jgi:hypothetical protein
MRRFLQSLQQHNPDIKKVAYYDGIARKQQLLKQPPHARNSVIDNTEPNESLLGNYTVRCFR